MFKHNVITILLAFVAMTGQAKQESILWERPAIGYSDIPYFQIQKVELTKEWTALHVRMSLMLGLGFPITAMFVPCSGSRMKACLTKTRLLDIL